MGADADAGSGEHDQVARFGQQALLAQFPGEQGADLGRVRPAYRPAEMHQGQSPGPALPGQFQAGGQPAVARGVRIQAVGLVDKQVRAAGQGRGGRGGPAVAAVEHGYATRVQPNGQTGRVRAVVALGTGPSGATERKLPPGAASTQTTGYCSRARKPG